MDGVLADSEPIYYRAMRDVLAPLGHKVTDEHQRAIMGHSIEDTWLYLQQAFNLKGPLDALVEMYDMELRRLLLQVETRKDRLRPVDRPAAPPSVDQCDQFLG